MFDKVKLTIEEKVKMYFDTLKSTMNNKDKFNDNSDVYTYVLKEKISDLDDMYDTRKETRELSELKGLIREQKRNLTNSLALFKDMDEKTCEFLSTGKGMILRNGFIMGYEYCIEKRFLDVAKYYLCFLSDNNLVDADYVQKGIFDIVSLHARISILSNSDQRAFAIDFINRVRDGAFKEAGKEIRLDALIRTYNEEGIDIKWDGITLKAHPQPELSKRDFSKCKLFRKN